MRIYFGLSFDDLVHPVPPQTRGGVRHLGPNGLLHVLESYLGLSGHDNNIEYLRIEQYRQALATQLKLTPEAFYADSFQADQFAAATELLSRRDELFLAGWSFLQPTSSCPPRLAALADIEALIRTPESPVRLAAGYAERFVQVLERLSNDRHPIREIFHHEPLDLLPFHYRRLFRRLESVGVSIAPIPTPPPNDPQTDLGRLRARFDATHPPRDKQTLQGDGSLLILKAKRDMPLAHFLAKLIHKNENYRPLCVIPEKSRLLDHALIQEGLPSLGILTASLSRPTIQVLKLAPVFLWRPIDPYKVMEFLSLAVKPLDDELADRLARKMAESPGLQSEGWRLTVSQYLKELNDRPADDKRRSPEVIRDQYDFWFERDRYDRKGTAPKEDVLSIYQRLGRWARNCFDEDGGVNQSLLFLSEQSKRICELLEALPEEQLTHLELERIVRTIYEPASIQIQPREKGCLPHVFQPQSIFGAADSVLWWNFIQNEPVYFFPRWYEHERRYLQEQDIHPQSPRQQNQLLVWQRKRPFYAARKQLLLVIPGAVNGSEKNPHPLYGDLHAAFANLQDITFDLDSGEGERMLARHFQIPGMIDIDHRMLGRPAPFIHIRTDKPLQKRDTETISSLETLFYYPYQWVFRHKIKLRKSSILSIVNDYTLMGNLAHRLFERLLKPEVLSWDQPTLRRWMNREAEQLLRREGAILLMYGREPDKVNFLKRVEYAAWSLINLIRDNGWQIAATEEPLQAHFSDTPVNGRADLVLERGAEKAVIDLKWRGGARRERLIRNEEDLQLILYAHLLDTSGNWAHTAYFIMEEGKMIARNQLAFDNCIGAAPDADHREVNERILQRMEETYVWRMKQIEKGTIEIRCERTLEELEDAYGAELMDVLEMKTKDAPFDDYRTLINLIE